MEARSKIKPEIAQEFFESCANPTAGQSQYYTPLEFGRALAKALPQNRLTITDLNCGNGQLLHASANETTLSLLGSDIDEAGSQKSEVRSQTSGLRPQTSPHPHLRPSRIQYDLTLLYPLLCEVDWTADLFVLNPPWRLWWHRERLKQLADSDCYAVRQAFNAIEPGSPRSNLSTIHSQPSTACEGTIDSTIATLLMALDRCTTHGEGLLIANNATLERLIFAPNAPHAAIADHIWAHLIIPGNPMTGIEDCKWQKLVAPSNHPSIHESSNTAAPFSTAVLYFARQHSGGPQRIEWTDYQPSTLNPQPLPSRTNRLGGCIRGPHGCSSETHPRWQIVKEQVAEIHGAKPKTPWNLWLGADGNIRTALSSFETHSHKLDKASANRLFKLNGESPMQLVLQRAQRDELLAVAEGGGWRVQPELLTAVRAAIASYHAARAPLFALSDIQRLGYCDEQDWMLCKKDLTLSAKPSSKNPPIQKSTLIFRAGRKYPLRTQTVEVTRKVSRPNATTDELEDCEYTGHELGIFLHNSEWVDVPFGEERPDEKPDTREHSFMDAKLKADKNTTIPESRSRDSECELPEAPVDFTLQQLVEHFDIPDVPDIATTNADLYKANLDKLTELENTLAELAA